MLTSTQSYVTYLGNGLTTVFPYSFPVQQAGQMVVSITNSTVSPPVTTVLSTSQYSVSGIGGASGGNVTYPVSGSPLPAGWSITIQRIVPYQQNTSLANQGAFYPAVVEAALDNLTMQVQQIAAAIFLLAGGIATPEGSFADILINGAWRLRDSGTALVIEHFEGGTWVEKSAITV
ncbi:MAG: hypothetical protein ABSG91_07010 [Syntrophobacteraceae bacterium]